jgi:hypothetical protein
MNNELVEGVCNAKIETNTERLIKLLVRLIIEEHKRSKL